MAEKSAHVSLCPAPSSERPLCQWKICPSRASSYFAALFPFHSLPLCLRVPLTTYTNFWPLISHFQSLSVFTLIGICFRLLALPKPSTHQFWGNSSPHCSHLLWNQVTMVLSFPYSLSSPSPCFFLDIADAIWCFPNWKSGFFSIWIIPEMTGEEEALQTPFGLHKKKDSILLFFLPILKIEPLVFCIVILPDLMSHSSQTLHINMFMYLLAWLGS